MLRGFVVFAPVFSGSLASLRVNIPVGSVSLVRFGEKSQLRQAGEGKPLQKHFG